jgi:hypothetical protein
MKTSLLCTLLGLTLLAGCSNMEYAIREKFGQQKRELLVERVQEAKDGQQAAKDQFVDALTRFKAVTGFSGGDLEAKYEEIKASYDRCSARAADVTEQIDEVADVANAMFREWNQELDQYSSQQLRESSARQLEQTRLAYDRLLEVMRAAEKRMAPVLGTLKDQVLYLKHHLNAAAIASLSNVTGELQRNIDLLLHDMERAIDDATRFIEQMQASGT